MKKNQKPKKVVKPRPIKLPVNDAPQKPDKEVMSNVSESSVIDQDLLDKLSNLSDPEMTKFLGYRRILLDHQRVFNLGHELLKKQIPVVVHHAKFG